jgi:hypothetical protein
LPSLPPPAVDPEAEARFTAVADELLAGEPVAIPRPRMWISLLLAGSGPAPNEAGPERSSDDS